MTSNLENRQTPEERIEEEKLIKIIEEKPIKIILDEPVWEEPVPEVTEKTETTEEPEAITVTIDETEAAHPVWTGEEPIQEKSMKKEKNGKNGKNGKKSNTKSQQKE